ncbi:MAG: BCSC C-terminal domain-containing protein [Acidobacteriota bacterium]|nr:BCSC C-terminal domain-containing protein [Acidobacteriota bacterium]
MPRPLLAQATPSAAQALLDKAHALEVRGRLDMAAQTWQQVLLADPNNAEALGGLARAAKFAGNAALANTYLDRLRAINPNDPNITRVQNMGSQQAQQNNLKQAGKLAESGQYAQAMALYRQAFGDTPPPGDWALAYYQTEAAIESSRPHAIEGLRAMMEKFPADSRYQVALGRILTYNPKTREEGRRLLEKHPADPQAVAALRQSLVWDSTSPAAAPDIRAFLEKHNDPQLAAALRNMPKTEPGRAAVAQSPEEIAAAEQARARSAEEQSAYAALNAKRLDDAESRFKAILANDPQNWRALAGLGYVRMQQSNFGSAISFLEQSKQNGGTDPGINTALETARFFSTLSEGATALNENDLPTAEQQYRAALNLRPTDTDALEGLGGTLMKAQQFDAAIEVFERYAKIKPSAAPAWRGLFMAYYQAGNAPGALQVERRIPPAVHAQLMKDPEFLRTLASAYSAVGRDADAQRVLHSALDLPFPAGAQGLKVETQLQYAALLQQANRLDQAAALYRQVLASDVANTNAWQGLIRVQHAAKDDAAAARTLQAMPPASYDVAMRDPGFQSTVASVYQAQNRLDAAQQILENSVSQLTSNNQKPSVGVMLQLAGIYLSRNLPNKAFPIYRQILTDNPERPEAWKGLLSVLHSSGRDNEALAQVQQIPSGVRQQLEQDVDYLQTIGAVYNALGQPQQAMVFLNRVQQHYALQHTVAPADVDIQDAWLLFNGGNDAGLYRQLMLLGARQDLSDEQRRTVQTIWTNWAVRRANQTAAAGNLKRSLAILNAAAKSFPDNPGVLRALASGYARAGLPKQAVAIFKTQDMTAATASDYKSAVGSALEAGDTKIAETWLRYGLDAYPKDAEMLILAAKFEEARGDSGRAAEYYRASLAAMPPADPGAELANELSLPAPVRKLPAPAQPQDLATLLRDSAGDSTDVVPQNQPPARPYLPSYNNLSGQAPVQIPNSGPGNGSSAVVPSYMAVPGTRSHHGATLGEYRPQTTSSLGPDPLGGIGLLPAAPVASANSGSGAETTEVAYGAPQARPGTLPATLPTGSAAPADSQGREYQLITSQPTGTAATSAPAPAPREEVYGAYVPYVPPAAEQQAWGYTPTPVPVQLGDSTPKNAPPPSELTDVLPTAKYVPNSRTDRSKSHAGAVLAGQSHPPQEEISSAPTENAQYVAQGQPGDSYGQQYPQPGTYGGAASSARARRRTSSASSTSAATGLPPLPPVSYPAVGTPLSGSAYPDLSSAAPTGVPPTDADLVAKSLPPLRGAYDPNASSTMPLSQRAQAEQDLSKLESSYSGWIGGTGYGRYRSGTVGLDRLTDLEAPFEASAVLGKTLRATIVPTSVFLSSGQIDTTLYQNATGTIPVLGTLSAAALNQPAQQFASGIGGEFQLTTKNIGLAVGYTPYGFLVTNVTGRLQWRPMGGHFVFYGDRSSVKDTQLSYAGMRDPGTVSAIYDGNIWGGVISSGGGLRIDKGTERSGFYVFADGADITGYHVLENQKFEGSMGSYFRAKVWPGYGSLNIGTSFFGMHYKYNERGMTYGQGGYFSPNVYFLADVPLTYNGYYKNLFHYTINGSVGLQTFQEDKAPYYPLDLSLQTGSGNAQFPLNSNTGLNYALSAEGSYRVGDHWYVGGYITGNNTNNYNTVSGGFFVRYLFKPQVDADNGPTGLFPSDGFRPLQVP